MSLHHRLFDIWLECDLDNRSIEYLCARLMDESERDYEWVIEFMVANSDSYCKYVDKKESK